MVPEGLVLLTSVAMAVATIRLAERKVLVQDMPAVEVLARVDVVCVDKTGTLTTGQPTLLSVATSPGRTESDVLALAAAAELGSDAPNNSAPVRPATTNFIRVETIR